MCCGSSFFRKSLFMMALLMSFLVLGWKEEAETTSACQVESSQFYLHSSVSQIWLKGFYNLYSVQHPLSLDLRNHFQIVDWSLFTRNSEGQRSVGPRNKNLSRVHSGKQCWKASEISSFMSNGEFVYSLLVMKQSCSYSCTIFLLYTRNTLLF